MWQWLKETFDKVLVFLRDCFVVQPKTIVPTQITYQANDPTTPDLRFEITAPSEPDPMKIMVSGLTVPAPWGSEPGDAATTFCTLATLLQYLKNIYDKPQKWAAVQVLQVYPRAGKQLNAYYDRQSLRYFYDHDSKGRMLYLCESSEVVGHECGHAILDALRPDFWSVASLETFAFHEAFADITAIVATMQYTQVLEKLMKETGGNLRQSNIVSKIGEDVGNVLGIHDGLRNAFNTYTYTPPEQLPQNAPYDQLSGECHSFGRLFLGAWYELMVDIYEYLKTKNMEPITALAQSRDLLYKLLLDAVVRTPNTPKLHEAIAKLMVSLASNEFQGIIKKVFIKRNLMGSQVLAMASLNWDQFEDKDKAQVVQGASTIAIVPQKRTMTLMQHVPTNQLSALAVSGYNLANLNVEVAADKFYEFDKEGNLLSMYAPEDHELAQITQHAVSSIKSIGPYEDTMWKVEDGNLVRTYFE